MGIYKIKRPPRSGNWKSFVGPFNTIENANEYGNVDNLLFDETDELVTINKLNLTNEQKQQIKDNFFEPSFNIESIPGFSSLEGAIYVDDNFEDSYFFNKKKRYFIKEKDDKIEFIKFNNKATRTVKVNNKLVYRRNFLEGIRNNELNVGEIVRTKNPYYMLDFEKPNPTGSAVLFKNKLEYCTLDIIHARFPILNEMNRYINQYLEPGNFIKFPDGSSMAIIHKKYRNALEELKEEIQNGLNFFIKPIFSNTDDDVNLATDFFNENQSTIKIPFSTAENGYEHPASRIHYKKILEFNMPEERKLKSYLNMAIALCNKLDVDLEQGTAKTNGIYVSKKIFRGENIIKIDYRDFNDFKDIILKDFQEIHKSHNTYTIKLNSDWIGDAYAVNFKYPENSSDLIVEHHITSDKRNITIKNVSEGRSILVVGIRPSQNQETIGNLYGTFIEIPTLPPHINLTPPVWEFLREENNLHIVKVTNNNNCQVELVCSGKNFIGFSSGHEYINPNSSKEVKLVKISASNCDDSNQQLISLEARFVNRYLNKPFDYSYSDSSDTEIVSILSRCEIPIGIAPVFNSVERVSAVPKKYGSLGWICDYTRNPPLCPYTVNAIINVRNRNSKEAKIGLYYNDRLIGSKIISANTSGSIGFIEDMLLETGVSNNLRLKIRIEENNNYLPSAYTDFSVTVDAPDS